MPEPNPIGEKYAEVMSAALNEHIGQQVTPAIISEVTSLVINTSCEFVGITEVADALEVSKQRASQLKLKQKLGPIAGRITAGPFWLKEQVLAIAESRVLVRDKYVGIPKRRK